MTNPEMGSPMWDAQRDEQDALDSLDDLEVTRVADTLPRDNPLMSAGPTSVLTPANTPMVQQMPPAAQPTTSLHNETTILRRKRTPRRANNDDERTLFRKRQVGVAPRPAVPSRPYDDDAVPVAKAAAPTGVPAGVGVLLLLVIFVLRLAAIALCALVIIAAIPALGYRVSLMPTLDLVTSLLPQQVAGLMVIPTPFGGAWRGDLVVAALTLYGIEWLLTRLRVRLKRG